MRYIVEVVDKLPRFQVSLAKENLLRLSNLGEVVEETSRGIKRIESWIAYQESDAEARQYELDYRMAVARNLDYLELFGADLSVEAKRHSLSVAYVSLNLESEANVGEEESETGYLISPRCRGCPICKT